MSYYGGQATKIKYDDSTMPTGSDEVVLFDSSVAAPGKHFFQQGGIRKFVANIVHSQDGNIRLHKSKDRFVAEDIQVSSTPLTAGITDAELLIEPYDDFKVIWENGGLDQASWSVDLALSDDRAAS